MATLGLSKVFILDKYFTELQKFWETEKKLQDASSSNEAVHLQQRLKNLSSELVTLRNSLHVGQNQNTSPNSTILNPSSSTNQIQTHGHANGNSLKVVNGGSNTNISLHNQQQQQQQQQNQHQHQQHIPLPLTTTVLELNASNTNLNNLVGPPQQQQHKTHVTSIDNNKSNNNNNKNNNNNSFINNFTANGIHLMQQQQVVGSTGGSAIFSTINNNNSSSNNNNNNNNSITTNCGKNNVNLVTAQQQQHIQVAAIATTSTISISAALTTTATTTIAITTPSSSLPTSLIVTTGVVTATATTTTTVINNSNNNNITNKSTHGLSHQNDSGFGSGSGGAVGAGGKVVSSRNTSIPHPLPHQINDKVVGHTFVTPTICGQKSQHQQLSTLNVFSHATNTLPTRSTFSSYTHNMQNQPLPFVPVQKHLQAGHNISNTLTHALTTAVGESITATTTTETISTHHINFNCIGTNLPIIQFNGTSMASGAVSNYGLNNCMSVYSQQNKNAYELDDLIHLSGPLTEDAVMRNLQARFNDHHYFTNIGPILLSINPYLGVGNPLTLSSTRSLPLVPQLRKIVLEAVRQQADTGYPQAIILSGTSGAGKTYCSMLLLRHLFTVAGGGPETDAFKHLAAAFTVLRSLGSAKTTSNSESSRIGQFIEVQVTDGALYRTKIHCYFLDQTRVIRPLPKEKNYHIFYQMLAGLSREECIKLNLEGYSSANLRYLQCGDLIQNEEDDAARFQAWKTCLGILGIPFLDVVRVLAAVLLLGNVQFIEGQSLEVDVKGESELNAVASLLGVPPAALFRGLTTRTHNARGQLVKSVCDANMSNMTRDCLAKALYCRTVATIVRRANSLKRLGSTLGTLSSDSNESVHNQVDVASQHASTIGGNPGSKSMVALNNAVRHATDGFIGILDMFGFEQPSPHAQLEHLCINLCAETMQHFYNTHIFKSSVESCRDEGILCDAEVDYVDNVPCIDLISSLRTGLLSMLDSECSVRGTAESYVAKIKVQHRNSTRLECKHTNEPHDPRVFTIRHFAGRVDYDATDFLDTNRDVVPDDLVAVFYKHTCNFGFATHLFGSELKALYALQNVPRGLSFRIAPTSHTDLLNGDEPVSTLTQDFHTRLDNLLRTLVHARPHFIRCIRSNSLEASGCFERLTVVKQIRSLQVLETVNLMASGFPHRMRFKLFNARYRMLAPFHLIRHNEDKIEECCHTILQYAMEDLPIAEGSVTYTWAPGKRHVFLSEGIRQHLENLRSNIRNKSATLIQAVWRGWQLRKKMGKNDQRLRLGVNNSGIVLSVPTAKSSKMLHSTNTNAKMGSVSNATLGSTAAPRQSTKNTNHNTVPRPRPQPIAGTPPPDPTEKCDTKIIQQTCNLFGLDLERPPPVPPSRNYTITGNVKIHFPQNRIMKMNFGEDAITNSSLEHLKKGETVAVKGPSTCRGHLIVEHKGQNFHVPYQFMELIRTTTINAIQQGTITTNIGVTTAATNKINTNNNSNNMNSNNNSNNVGNPVQSAAIKV